MFWVLSPHVPGCTSSDPPTLLELGGPGDLISRKYYILMYIAFLQEESHVCSDANRYRRYSPSDSPDGQCLTIRLLNEKPDILLVGQREPRSILSRSTAEWLLQICNCHTTANNHAWLSEPIGEEYHSIFSRQKRSSHPGT